MFRCLFGDTFLVMLRTALCAFLITQLPLCVFFNVLSIGPWGFLAAMPLKAVLKKERSTQCARCLAHHAS